MIKTKFYLEIDHLDVCRYTSPVASNVHTMMIFQQLISGAALVILYSSLSSYIVMITNTDNTEMFTVQSLLPSDLVLVTPVTRYYNNIFSGKKED